MKVLAIIVLTTAVLLSLSGNMPADNQTMVQLNPTPASTNYLTKSESLLLEDVNDYRIEHGLPVVVLDWRLVKAARGHAADMYIRDYFAHRSPEGGRLGQRGHQAGYDYRYMNENLGMIVGPSSGSYYNMVIPWSKSPGHNSNLLDDQVVDAGVGVVGDANRAYYVLDMGDERP